MTRYFKLIALLPAIMGWRIFEARQYVKEKSFDHETGKMLEFGPVVKVAIKETKAASVGLYVECENVIEDKGNATLFLHGSRDLGVPKPKQNPPKPKKLRVPANTTKVATISTFLNNDRIRAQRLKQYA